MNPLSLVTLIVGILFLITGVVGIFQKDPTAYIQLMFGATWLKLASLEGLG